MSNLAQSEDRNAPVKDGYPHIVVVGPCAAGKSTLVKNLRDLGFDAHVSAQEHSEIATLWRHSQPDVLIALDVGIDAVHSRRGDRWPEWLHNVQSRRLADAFSSADMVIDTSTRGPKAILDVVVAYIETRVGRRSSVHGEGA